MHIAMWRIGKDLTILGGKYHAGLADELGLVGFTQLAAKHPSLLQKLQ